MRNTGGSISRVVRNQTKVLYVDSASPRAPNHSCSHSEQVMMCLVTLHTLTYRSPELHLKRQTWNLCQKFYYQDLISVFYNCKHWLCHKWQTANLCRTTREPSFISFRDLMATTLLIMHWEAAVASCESQPAQRRRKVNVLLYLSLLNLRECRIAGIFCLRFHRWMLSSAKALTSAPCEEVQKQRASSQSTKCIWGITPAVLYGCIMSTWLWRFIEAKLALPLTRLMNISDIWAPYID